MTRTTTAHRRALHSRPARLVVALVAAFAAAPAGAIVVTQDARGAAVQISGASPAAGVPFFADADAAANDAMPAFEADLAVERPGTGLSASAAAWQTSTLTVGGGLLRFGASGAVDAAGHTGDAGDTLLAAAVSNATLAFSLDAPATLTISGSIDGSGLGDDGTRFGLTAVSLVSNGNLVVDLAGDTATGTTVDLVAALAPGDFVLTLVASTSATALAGAGPVSFAETAGYDLAFTVATVPLPGGLGLLAIALAALLGRSRVSGASC